MSDAIEDLVRIYVGAVPRDVFDTALGEDVAYTIAEMFGLAYQEVQRLAAGSVVADAVGLFLDLHARDRGLRRQENETDTQLRERLKRPPLAGTTASILEALEPLVGTQAFLDLAPLTSNCETVVQAKARGSIGNTYSLQFIADGVGVGSLTVTDVAHVFHYQSGVTTVANFQAAVAASTLIEVKTSDASGTLTSPGDTFPKTYFGQGLNTAIIVELPRHAAFYDMGHCYDMGMRMGGGRGVVIALIPASANALSAVSDAVRSKVSAGKIWLVEEY